MTHIESAEPLSTEQKELWDRVEEIWGHLQRRDVASMGAAIHPQYIGWEASSLLPHDRDFALKVAETDPQVVDFHLFPMHVEVYDGLVGVVHYTFEANVAGSKGKTEKVSGRWTEVYLKKDNVWLMISVSGGAR